MKNQVVFASDVFEELTKKHTPDSKHLKGRLNISIIKDTFLVEAEKKFPDTSFLLAQ